VKAVVDRKKLFNPEGDDTLNARKIIKGNSTNLFNLNNVRYQWANQLYRTMMANFWIPEKVDLTQDKNDYENLTLPEREAYDGILSFLIFLDSIQTNNIPNISDHVTAPEVNMLLAIQTFQEAIHSQSYQYIIESILPKQSRDLIYDKWRDDKVLFERNRNKMVGTSDIIRLINRDELSHVVLFRSIVKEIKNDYPEFFSAETIYSMFKTAVEQEINWTEHIIGNRVLGITSQTTEAYTKWLANERLKSLGLEPLYSGFNKNPYKHLERFADTEGEGNVKSNFFEGTVTSYNMSSSIDGWEDF